MGGKPVRSNSCSIFLAVMSSHNLATTVAQHLGRAAFTATPALSHLYRCTFGHLKPQVTLSYDAIIISLGVNLSISYTVKTEVC